MTEAIQGMTSSCHHYAAAVVVGCCYQGIHVEDNHHGEKDAKDAIVKSLNEEEKIARY